MSTPVAQFSLLKPVHKKKFPLHHAVYNSKITDVKKLLKACPILVESVFLDITPLFFAIEKGSMSMENGLSWHFVLISHGLHPKW